MLCLPSPAKSSATSGWLITLAGLFLSCGSGLAAADTQSLAPQQKLLAQVQQWVAQTRKVAPAEIEIAPLDARLRIQDCASPLAMDHPFASRESVRVRCTAEPAWQLYLRVAAPSTSQQVARGQPVSEAPLRRAVIARRLLQRGQVLTPDMLEEVMLPLQGLDPQSMTSLKDIQMAELIRDIPAGSVLRSYDIRRAVLVRQGQSVLFSTGQGSGFEVKVRVEALQDGYLGEQVRLKNPESGRFISGTVTGPNAVSGL